MGKLTTFERNEKTLELKFLETQQVKNGVVCDVYEFVTDNSCDLGIVAVESGRKTPRQKILSGDKTIEGYVSGQGVLEVKKPDGKIHEYMFPSTENEVELHVGDTMQWIAETDLVFYEICYPAYSDGRFQNLD
ncbi:MAG: hypothetical protein U5L95_04225 [Candidatus Saccharibacteria bacterium]|nr:hypothetical protein [Candidatus Saccharibacteria bacterium]